MAPAPPLGAGLGERAHERFAVVRPAMGGEEVLDRQVEQRAQSVDDLLARRARSEPAGVDLRSLAEVGERVARDDRPVALDPEHEVVALLSRERLDSDTQAIARGVPVRLAGLPFDQPPHVRADPTLW